MANDEQGSSSNPRPIRPTPRRSRARTPQGHVNRLGEWISPSQTRPVIGVPGQSAFTNYPRPPPQQPMGVPGQSAFNPYARPGQPRCSPLGSSSNVGTDGGVGFGGGQAVAVGGSGGSGDGALRIGGSPAARKMGQEGGVAGGDQPAAAPDNQVRCTVCGRVFRTPKGLFGHMRTHPDRGWKGAHPPPAFRAEEEFADIRGEGEAEAGGGGEATEEREVADQEYSLPDLNKQPPPPPDSN